MTQQKIKSVDQGVIEGRIGEHDVSSSLLKTKKHEYISRAGKGFLGRAFSATSLNLGDFSGVQTPTFGRRYPLIISSSVIFTWSQE